MRSVLSGILTFKDRLLVLQLRVFPHQAPDVVLIVGFLRKWQRVIPQVVTVAHLPLPVEHFPQLGSLSLSLCVHVRRRREGGAGDGEGRVGGGGSRRRGEAGGSLTVVGDGGPPASGLPRHSCRWRWCGGHTRGGHGRRGRARRGGHGRRGRGGRGRDRG